MCAEAALRALLLLPVRRDIDGCSELNQSPPCLMPSSCAMASAPPILCVLNYDVAPLFRLLPGVFRPSGFWPCPLVVLCATLNQEPPSFFVAPS